VQASAEYQTIQVQPLGLGMCWACIAKAVHVCGTVGKARDELHGALRDWKHKGKKVLRFSKV
jgi:hypothetical protein